MYNIKLLNKISAAGLSVLDPAKYNCSDSVADYSAVIVRSASMHDAELPGNLLAIARAGAGTNNIPIDKCTEQGIVVFNTPGGNANAVKELTITGLLLSGRKIFEGMRWAQGLNGEGDQVSKLVEKGKSNFVGPELMGKTLGVVGLGAIGTPVANTALALGMEVVGYDPFLSVPAACKLDARVKVVKTLKEIYQAADFISLHLPVNAETKGMINAASIAMMKHPVRIVNFARGDLVNNADLLAALDTGDVGCYVTDFPSDEVLDHPGVVALPHLGASTPESEDNCAAMAASQLKDFLESGNIRNSVNLPGLEVPRDGKVRVAVIHKNRDGLADAIVGAIGSCNGSASATRGDIAYTVADLDSIPGDAVGKIEGMDGILRVLVFQ